MDEALLYLLLGITYLLFGYNLAFKTTKTMSKFISLSKYKEGSFFYKALSSKRNIIRIKITGIGAMIFALFLFVGLIKELMSIYVE